MDPIAGLLGKTGNTGMDPLTAGILAGSSLMGGLAQGIGAQGQSQQQGQLEEILGKQGLDVQSAAVGDQLARQMATMPLRDRVLAQLNARMGQSPAQFNPYGLYGNKNAPATTGGVDMSALQSAANNYVPGSGGTRPDLAAAMLGKIGYAPAGNGYGNPWQQQLTQGFTPLGRNWSPTEVGALSAGENVPGWAAGSGGQPGSTWNPNNKGQPVTGPNAAGSLPNNPPVPKPPVFGPGGTLTTALGGNKTPTTTPPNPLAPTSPTTPTAPTTKPNNPFITAIAGKLGLTL